MAGYQGWFNAPGDGSQIGWRHYPGRIGFRPGSASIDLWPEVSEYRKTYDTPFKFADGTTAKVFSSHDSTTVDTHFRWMKEYGLDGVFMQRFVSDIKGSRVKAHFDYVLDAAMTSANIYSRAIAVMYDLSGMNKGDEDVLLKDISVIAAKYHLFEHKKNPSYLYHNGHPLVAVWGIGFNDGRNYGLDEAEKIVTSLKNHGFSVMIGVPAYWRELKKDAVNDSRLLKIIEQCDVVMPWFVTRYNEQNFDKFSKLIVKDMDWCKVHKLSYAPLCFPGFSWANLKYPNGSKDFIPRNKGRFLQKQIDFDIKAGAKMLYIAMFDELDEGTAIMKCAKRVPVGQTGSSFVPIEEGIGSDHYLKIVGDAAKRLKSANMPFKQKTYDFSDDKEQFEAVGRGDCHVSNGVFFSKDSYVRFGSSDMRDYTFSFKARAPQGSEQVQIWAGFRAANRNDRYVVGIKGGIQDDIYLLRLGYMGSDEFMGVRPLGFHPEVGKWYKLKVEVVGQRIRVFVGDEEKPRIDIVDKNGAVCSQGYVTLGGGWIPTEFDDLVITPLPSDALNGVSNEEQYDLMSAQQKEELRQKQRSAYKPIEVTKLKSSRTDVSLDGNWLFMPTYQLDDQLSAVNMTKADDNWHIMSVPNMWTPIRVWLHGETMGSPRGQQPKGVSDTYFQAETARCENYTFDYAKTRSAWYRQWVVLPESIKGKHMTLHFDAISKAAEIYINGQLAGSHIGMFGEINIDGTNFFKPGKNLIAVKVIRSTDDNNADLNNQLDAMYSNARDIEARDEAKPTETTHQQATNLREVMNKLPHGFFCEDEAGIWQPASLIITDQVNITDAFIKPSLTGASFEVTVKNNNSKKSQFNILTDIIDKETGETIYSNLSLKALQLKGGEEKVFAYNIDGLKPKLWSPDHPNLYDFHFHLSTGDELKITSGFRTFEVKNGLFYLNGVKYWLRGGNQAPSAICPYDSVLAHKFFKLMTAGNLKVTRTHTCPYNELWMNAADEEGIGVSFEGTWPWLMLGSEPIPDKVLLDLWRKEFLELVKKYRNHPSLLIWTINNEMKFYDLDDDKERAKQKMAIISDVVKEIRKIDPTHPISFDSNYIRRGHNTKFGKDFYKTIDDGDIDDMHAYYNWYDFSMFRFFNGEFDRDFKTPGRPLISQEMSTGYPNNETGHPTRSYQIIHQNPTSLVGYQCYDFSNPKYFLDTQAFITGELTEALRRTDPEASGILLFSLHTWFKQVYDANKIKPWPTYYALARASQPVLVSAELWGRHLYSGEKLTTRFYVVNDREDGSTIKSSLLKWRFMDENGNLLTSGLVKIPEVKNYEHYFMEPDISIPKVNGKQNVKFELELDEGGKVISRNEYQLLIADKSSIQSKSATQKIALLVGDNTAAQLDFLNVKYAKCSSVKELLRHKNATLVISGINEQAAEDVRLLRNFVAKGGRLLLLNCKELAKQIYPEYIEGWIIPTEGDITFMENDNDKVFDGIDYLDLRYFNNNKREMPKACNATLKTKRDCHVDELCGQMKIHAYIDGGRPEDRLKRISSMRGFTMVRIHDGKGSALVSTMCTEKASTDPVAGQLLVNLLTDNN